MCSHSNKMCWYVLFYNKMYSLILDVSVELSSEYLVNNWMNFLISFSSSSPIQWLGAS